MSYRFSSVVLIATIVLSTYASARTDSTSAKPLPSNSAVCKKFVEAKIPIQELHLMFDKYVPNENPQKYYYQTCLSTR